MKLPKYIDQQWPLSLQLQFAEGPVNPHSRTSSSTILQVQPVLKSAFLESEVHKQVECHLEECPQLSQ